MTVYEIAYRYANALFDLPLSKEQVNQWLSEIEEIFFKVPQLVAFLQAPQISFQKKEEVLKKVFERLSLPEEMFNFLMLLVRKERIKYFQRIARAYKQVLQERGDIVTATLVVTHPDHHEIQDKVRRSLEKSYRKKIVVNEKIDKKIIGGMILYVANKMLDMSIKGRLESLKEKLLETSV